MVIVRLESHDCVFVISYLNFMKIALIPLDIFYLDYKSVYVRLGLVLFITFLRLVLVTM